MSIALHDIQEPMLMNKNTEYQHVLGLTSRLSFQVIGPSTLTDHTECVDAFWRKTPLNYCFKDGGTLLLI